MKIIFDNSIENSKTQNLEMLKQENWIICKMVLGKRGFIKTFDSCEYLSENNCSSSIVN